MLFSDWWEELDRPHRLLDQHFGLSLDPEDLPTSLSPLLLNGEIVVARPQRRGLRRYQPYERSLRRATGVSTIQPTKDKFEVTLDVQQFTPEEVTVKVVGRTVIIEGKHEEKQDEHGWISRQFVRKYLIPEQCDIEQLNSKLSSDGVLTITAPRNPDDPEKKERVIKIQKTGQPALRDESRSDRKEQDSPAKAQAQQRGQEKTVKAA